MAAILLVVVALVLWPLTLVLGFAAGAALVGALIAMGTGFDGNPVAFGIVAACTVAGCYAGCRVVGAILR